MTTRRLGTLLGEPAQANTSDQRAQNILDSLKYGYNLGFVCGYPQLSTQFWGRIRVLERRASDEAPAPFERLATALAGLKTVMEFAVMMKNGELALCVGFRTAAELSRSRRILAPGCVIEDECAPTLTEANVIGVTQRVQAVSGDTSSFSPTVEALFDKLETIASGWTLFLHCEGTSMTEGLNTLRKLDGVAEEAAANLSATWQVTDTASSTAVSHRWSRIQDWTAAVARLLAQGAGVGLWTVDTWATSDRADTARLLAGALHASIPGDQGRWYETLDYFEPSVGEPAPTSVLTSHDLGRLLEPPTASKPGLAVRLAPPAGRHPSVAGKAMTMGYYQGTDVPAVIGLEDLEGHAFVTGTTGSGKSTTLHRLLAELWNRHGIPFLVLDPVKDDYSSAAKFFRGGIRRVRGADVHMNLLEPWPGEDSREHITKIASAFRGAFSMPSPTPYVVTQLFDRVAMLPSGGAGMSLFDVRDMVPNLISSLGYAPEQESNIRAALMTRLNLLLAPTRAHRFCWTSSDMVRELFLRPTVVTLADLGDDEERSFVVLLLALAAWAQAKNRTAPRAVEHLLVLEEAHRILPEIDERRVDPESGSAKQVSANLLSSMLAEVRSYGEQLIVVDQSPSRVSAEVSRNTNLKIAHRIVHPEDQIQVAGMLGLPQDGVAVLGELDRGHAICTTRTEPSAQTMTIVPLGATTSAGYGGVAGVGPPVPSWPCGSNNPEAHFRAWQLGPAAAGAMSLFLSGVLWGNGNGRKLREQVYRELLVVADGEQSLTDCLAWAGLRQLTARRRMAGPGVGSHSARTLLSSLYALWAGRLPVTKDAADGLVIFPPPHGALVGDQYLTWEEQAIASTLLHEEPRNGMRLLRSSGWRSELPDLGDYLKNREVALAPVLGAGAKDLLRILVKAAVASANLTTDVAYQLMNRAGLAPGKTI